MSWKSDKLKKEYVYIQKSLIKLILMILLFKLNVNI